MAFKYRYRPPSKNRSLERIREIAKTNFRNLVLLIISMAVIFSFSILSERISGYAAYSADIESSLNETLKQLNTESKLKAECNINLGNTKVELASCSDRLTSSQAYLVSCEDEQNRLKSYSDQLNSIYSACESERADLKTKYATEAENYKASVRNSVRAICCSFSDSQTGTEKSWGIQSNQIVCTGNFLVNCTTGYTNY